MTELLIIGAGYTGKTLARQAIAHPEITRVIGTSRSDSTLDALDAMGAHHARHARARAARTRTRSRTQHARTHHAASHRHTGLYVHVPCTRYDVPCTLYLVRCTCMY